MTRAEALAKSLAALIRGDVETAASIASSFHGGAGSLYENESIAIVRFILEHDYTPDPAIKPEVLARLRIVAAAMELWGEVDIKDIADVSGSWKYKHSPELGAQLLYKAGLEQHRLQRLRDMGSQEIEIRANHTKDLCPACKSDLGLSFPIHAAPFLPHPGCSCEYSCNCRYIAHQSPPLSDP